MLGIVLSVFVLHQLLLDCFVLVLVFRTFPLVAMCSFGIVLFLFCFFSSLLDLDQIDFALLHTVQTLLLVLVRV